MQNCPCGSLQKYNNCCGIYINGKSIPKTPEQLMRSRYTAYTLANINYIQKTMKAPASNNFNFESAKLWAQNVKWLGLEIINTNINKTKGYVEFIAHFSEYEEKKYIHEISEFHQTNSEWYYTDGKQKKTKPYLKAKIGRNDPCSCGSGKKYKICCLAKI